MNENPRDQQTRVELAREAKDFMDNRAVVAVLGALRAQWINEVETGNLDRERAYELSIRLSTLAAIPAMLRSLMASPQRGADGRGFGRSGA